MCEMGLSAVVVLRLEMRLKAGESREERGWDLRLKAGKSRGQ